MAAGIAGIALRRSRADIDAALQEAIALARSGAPGGAARALAQLTELHGADARHPGVRNALGVLRLEQSDAAGAIALLKPLARETPNAAGIHLNLGNALVSAGRAGDAIAPLRHAASLEPSSPVVQYGHARALQIAGRIADAVRGYETVLRLDPHHADARSNLAAAYSFLDRYADAEREARALLLRHPEMPGAHFNLGVALLSQGQWDAGWAAYEWRDRTGLLDASKRAWEMPRWEGEPLHGRTLLVHAEQGFGDTLQFVRYLPLLRAAGARVVLQCPRPLVALLSASGLADAVLAFGDARPPYDLQVPLTGVPHRLRLHDTRSVTVSNAPYLAALDTRVPATVPWRGAGLRVGLVWAGSATHVNDMHRSCGLGVLQPLLRLPDVECASLQTGDAARALTSLPRALRVHDLAPSLADFADTAAAIAALDVVVSVDSAVAHLAAAMGRRTLLLLPRVGLDWRWAPDGIVRQWYGAMEPFRQERAGDWAPVVRAVGARLVELAAASPRQIFPPA